MEDNHFEIGDEVVYINDEDSFNIQHYLGSTKYKNLEVGLTGTVKFMMENSLKVLWDSGYEWWVYKNDVNLTSNNLTKEERHKKAICNKILSMYHRRKEQGYAF